MARDHRIDALKLTINGDASGAVLAFKQVHNSLLDVEHSTGAVNAAIRRMAIGITVAYGAMAKKALDFDKAIVRSNMTLNAGEDQIKKARKDMLALSQVTTHSAIELAGSMEYLGQAGLDFQQISANSYRSVKLVSAFARAGNFELKTATDLLTDAATAMAGVEGLTKNGDIVGDMSIIADALTKTASAANASVSELSRALTNKAGNAAKMFNVSLEDTVTLLGVYASQGRKGAAAGSLMEQTFRYLTQSYNKAKDQYIAHGIKPFEENGQVDVYDFITKINEALLKFDGPDKVAERFNFLTETLQMPAKGMMGIFPLIGMSEQFKQILERSKEAMGVQARLREFVNSAAGTFQIFTNRLQLFAIMVGEALMPALKFLMVLVSKLIDLFKFFVELPLGNTVLFWGSTLALAAVAVAGLSLAMQAAYVSINFVKEAVMGLSVVQNLHNRLTQTQTASNRAYSLSNMYAAASTWLLEKATLAKSKVSLADMQLEGQRLAVRSKAYFASVKETLQTWKEAAATKYKSIVTAAATRRQTFYTAATLQATIVGAQLIKVTKASIRQTVVSAYANMKDAGAKLFSAFSSKRATIATWKQTLATIKNIWASTKASLSTGALATVTGALGTASVTAAGGVVLLTKSLMALMVQAVRMFLPLLALILLAEALMWLFGGFDMGDFDIGEFDTDKVEMERLLKGMQDQFDEEVFTINVDPVMSSRRLEDSYIQQIMGMSNPIKSGLNTATVMGKRAREIAAQMMSNFGAMKANSAATDNIAAEHIAGAPMSAEARAMQLSAIDREISGATARGDQPLLDELRGIRAELKNMHDAAVEAYEGEYGRREPEAPRNVAPTSSQGAKSHPGGFSGVVTTAQAAAYGLLRGGF